MGGLKSGWSLEPVEWCQIKYCCQASITYIRLKYTESSGVVQSLTPLETP
jgi:hypothetical protein